MFSHPNQEYLQSASISYCRNNDNALQGVQVDFELFVQAVQGDNNTIAENADVDISAIGVDGADNSANPAAECIKAFYIVEESHEIEVAP